MDCGAIKFIWCHSTLMISEKMVKLQKRFAYKYKGKNHFKYVVTIPAENIEKMGWDSGKELNWSISENTLLLKAREESEEKERENDDFSNSTSR